MSEKDYVLIKIEDGKIIGSVMMYHGRSTPIESKVITGIIEKTHNVIYEETPEHSILRLKDPRVFKKIFADQAKREKSNRITNKILAGMCALTMSGGAIALFTPNVASEPMDKMTIPSDGVSRSAVVEVVEHSIPSDPVAVLEERAKGQPLEITEPTPEEVKSIENNVAIESQETTPPVAEDYFDQISYIEPTITEAPIVINYSEIADPQKYEYTKDNYEGYCEIYGKRYGVDPKLLLAFITQENPYNEKLEVNRGVCCIENIWWGTELTAFNHETGQYDTITIDVNQLSNPEYSILVAAMIDGHYFEHLCNECPNISNRDKILAIVIGNNKGIYPIEDLIKYYGSDFVNHIPETAGGDNYYIEHVLSNVPDGSMIEMTNAQGEKIYAVINVVNQPSLSR